MTKRQSHFTFYTQSTWRRKVVAWAMLILTMTQPVLASAEAIADPKAPGQNRPIVESTANNLPVVQITTPSAAGVSRNLYQQFNVDPRGLILNNSGVITQTQLAGYITGNPYLGTGPSAKVILNEVTGNNPSYLRGYTEVAGQKAEVIIANPSGIYGDGFGFINTSRAVLTTGTPVFGGSGSLDAFRVTGGQISIQGAGMNAADVDQVDLISRSVAINAGVWAKNLNVVAGTNQVDYNTLNTQTIAGDANQPTVAIDVGQLGGMYALKIYLVGTEKGVGVNSKGTIAAQAGDVTITSAGKVLLAGNTSATGNIQVAAGDDVTNQNTLYAQGNTNITTQGILKNSGTLAAGQHTTLSAQSITSTGTLGAGVKNDGTLGSTGDLTLSTTGTILARGQNMAVGNLTVHGTGIDLVGSKNYAGGNVALTATAGGIDHTGASLQASTATILASDAVHNDKDATGNAASIQAGLIQINASSISNIGSKITQTGTGDTNMIATNIINNTSGEIATNANNLTIKGDTLNNSQGKITHAGTGVLNVNTNNGVTNTSGSIITKGKMEIATSSLDSGQGTITASGAISINSQNNVNNQGGIVEAGKGLTINAQGVANKNGSMTSLDSSGLTINAGQNIDNTSGTIGSNGDVNLKAQSLSNQSGKIAAQGGITASAEQNMDNMDGSLTANQDIAIKASSMNGGGKAAAGQDLTIAVNGSFHHLAGGEFQASRDVTIVADNFSSQGSISAVRNVTVNANNITNDTGAQLASGASLKIISAGDITNGGTLEGNGVSVNGQNITNGGIIVSRQDTTIIGQGVQSSGVIGAGINSDGSVGTSGDLTIAATDVISATGKNLAGRNLSVTGTAVNQSAAITYAGGTAKITATNGDVDHTGASLQAKGAVTISASGAVKNDKSVSGTVGKITADNVAITAKDISNKGGSIQQTGSNATNLIATNSIDNTGGTIATNGVSLTLQGSAITNNQGTVNHAGTGTLTVKTIGDLNSNGGTIATNGQGNIQAQNIDNTKGTISAQKQAAITATSLTNSQGTISSNNDSVTILVQGGITNTQQGLIQANKGLNVTAQSLNNQNGSVQNIDGSDLNLAIIQDVQNQSGLIGGNGNVSVTGQSLANQGGQVVANGSLTIAAGQGVDNTSGTLFAKQDLNLNSNITTASMANLTNTNGSIQAGNSLTVQAAAVNNVGGTLAANQDIQLTAQSFNGGKANAGQDLTITLSGDLTNAPGGVLKADRNLALHANGKITNQGSIAAVQNASVSGSDITNDTGATTAANGKLNLTATGNLVNNGRLNGSAVSVSGQNVNNTGTVIADILTLEANTISNGAGAFMKTTGDINLGTTVNPASSVTNQGTVYAQGNTNVTTTGALTNGGMLLSGQNTIVAAQSVSSTGTFGAGINSDGTIGNAGDLSITATGAIGAAGKNLAGGNLAITGTSVDQSGATTTVGGTATITATNGDVNHTGASLQANGEVKINATGTVQNDKNAIGTAGQLQGKQVTIQANSISNKGGIILQTGSDATNLTAASSMDNTGGIIATNGSSLSIQANSVTNSQGQIQHTGTGSLTLAATGDLKNDSGMISSNGTSLTIQANHITNTQSGAKGGIQHAGNGILTIKAASNLDNTNGKIATNGELELKATGGIANQGGFIGTQNQAVIQSQGNIDNSNNGLIAVGDNLKVTTQSDVINTGGIIQAANGLTLNGKNFNNAGGKITNTGSAAPLTIDVTNTLNNQAGFIGSNGKLAINAASINNANNTMSAQGDFAMTVNGDFTNQGHLEANGALSINAINMNNSAIGTINSDKTNITASGNISNDGRIEGNQVTATSQNMSNTGTVIGNTITVNANNLNNQGKNALVAATNSVNLWVTNTLTNQDGATMISLGDLNIAANSQRDATGMLVNRTQQVNNIGSTIEANGNINLAAENVTNTTSGDPVIGTTASTSTKVLTMAPHLQYDVSYTYTDDNGNDQDYVQHHQFGGLWQWGNNQNGYYCKLLVAVPKDNILSYDANQKKLVFNDVAQTTFQGISNRGENISDIENPTWSGKEPGKTTAYCQSVEVNAAGDYVITFYPGYDPNVHLSPENQRTMPTRHSNTSPEERRTTTTDTQTEYIASAPTIGQIHVGQNLNLNIGQQFTNKYSQVAVGNSVTGNISTLQNEGYRLQQTNTSTDVSYFHDSFVTGGGWSGAHLEDSSGWQTVGPYSSTNYIAGGLPATFTAKNILVTGTNVANIEQRPDGTPAPQIGATINPTAPTSTSISTTNAPTVDVKAIGNGIAPTTTVVPIGAEAGNTKVQVNGTSVSQGATVTETTTKQVDAVTATGSTTAIAGLVANTNGTPVSNKLTSGQTVDFSIPGNTGHSLLTIPQNGLYKDHAEPTAKYVVETNPRFTNYRNFISSDYMMNQVSSDPAKVHKRLGDGFYEQKLVNEQISQLTGRQYLSGYDNTDTEFKALMDNGVAAAKTLALVPGIALTSTQIANLTKDLVWMVEQQVTLPDGTTQRVLVPQVYLSQANTMKLTESGALIAADKIDMRMSGNIDNSGTIIGNSSSYLQATTISNRNDGLITGNGVTSLVAANDIINQSSTISGKQVLVFAGGDVINETTTRDISASTKDTNTGHSWVGTNTVIGSSATIQSQGDLKVVAGHDVSIQGGNIVSSGDAVVNAGRNLNVGTVVAENKSVDTAPGLFYSYDKVSNVTSTIQGANNIALTSKDDTTLTGVQINAGKDLTVKVQGDLTVNAVKDSYSSDAHTKFDESTYKHTATDESVIGSTLKAGKDVTISAIQLPSDKPTVTGNHGNITIEGSSIISQNGSVAVQADKDITVKEVTEKHESLTESHDKTSGFLSSKTTDTRDYSLINQVKGSTISGDKVTVSSGKDLTVQGSNVVGTNDVTLTAADNVNITSAKETGKDEHYREEKTSGIFSGGGLGLTIGSKSEKTTNTDQTLDQVGSTVGSINGNVTVTAGNKVDSAGTTFATGKDLNITGKDVTIDNTINTVDSQSKYEFKQSGLTVSLGGGAVTAAVSAAGDIRRSSQVEDGRLKALYDYKAVEDIKDLGKSKGNLSTNVGINVSFGSSQTTTEQTSHTETVNTSNINAGGNVNIKATAGDVNLKGTNINATDVTLDAKNNINIDSGVNKQQTTSNTSSSSWSVGGTIGVGFNASASKGSGNENENITTHTGSVINASDTLTLKSGNDTNITGSQVKGDKVVANIGGDLNIASVQDTDNYTAKNQNIGIGVSTGQVDGKPLPSGTQGPINKVANGGVTGSFSQGKTDSNYASVTDQAGIFAGKDGFNITVGKNTDLKGAVISSDATPDKNKLSTDTLTYSDIQNKADYNSSSIGVNVNTKPDAKYNQQGVTPNIGVPASGDASSTTKSAISPGTIEIRSNPNQDISGLSRDTTNSLNTLGKIFDKQTVKERQELAGLFGELAFEEIHKLSDQKGWDEGSPQRIALHALIGGIMSQLTGNGFGSGAAGAGFNELINSELSKITDPALRQWASYIISTSVTGTVGGVTALYGTKYNDEWGEWRRENKIKTKGADVILIQGSAGLDAVMSALGVNVPIPQSIKDYVSIGGSVVYDPVNQEFYPGLSISRYGFGSVGGGVYGLDLLDPEIAKMTGDERRDRLNDRLGGVGYQITDSAGPGVTFLFGKDGKPTAMGLGFGLEAGFGVGYTWPSEWFKR